MIYNVRIAYRIFDSNLFQCVAYYIVLNLY